MEGPRTPTAPRALDERKTLRGQVGAHGLRCRRHQTVLFRAMQLLLLQARRRGQARLSAFLRSLAFQMASADPGIRGALMKLQEDRWKVNHDNERSLWRGAVRPDVLDKAASRTAG